ncbi:WD40-repeat-containing domain protein [Haematococcus lacustris]
MRPSPSAIYCNLSLLGPQLAYAHSRQACTVDPGTSVAEQAMAVRRVDSQHVVHTIRAMPHGTLNHLLVCTDDGVQVWDRQVKTLLFSWAFPEPERPAPGAPPPPSGQASGVGLRHALFARGAAMNIACDGSANMCFGASNGCLYVLEFDESGRLRGPTRFPHHTAPITALSSAYASRQGRWTDDLGSSLVSADESGSLTVWEAASASSYKAVASLGEAKVPAVALAVRQEFVVAARLDGCIQVFSLRSKVLRAELAAHSRFLTCMDIHPTKDIIVTGAEDGSISVMTLPIGAQKTSSLLSVLWMHAPVAGVAFCGTHLDDVAAVAYDTDELQLYRTTCPT